MSAKRMLLTAVLCLGLIFGFFQGVSAQSGNVCLIFVGASSRTFSNTDCDGGYTAGYGWVAVSRGLVSEYIKANSITASFTGDNNVSDAITPKQASNLWGPIESLGDDLIGAHCPTGLVYRSQFRWNLGKLAPGTYTLYFLDTLRNPLNDGTVSCTDDQGQHLPNIIYSGAIFDNVNTVTITP